MSTNTPYIKHHSFDGFHSRIAADPDAQRQRALLLLETDETVSHLPAYVGVRSRARQALAEPDSSEFRITPFIADEMSVIEDIHLPRYVYHRYRYDVYPKSRELDAFPPYLQIEPSSVCNFRCVFCYQTDKVFASRNSGMMGKMSLELFKRIVDEVETHVEFGSLASRGEPLINSDIDDMLAYCRGKFLGFKMNTNASLLTEERSHAILSSGLRTIVFSADAAEEPTYSQFRVNGSLEETLRNVAMFERIRQQQYSRAPIITRVSGVMFDDARQDLASMISFWRDHVDQVSFVRYNPWEKIYDAAPTGIDTPCSDLWRRMFVWFDGKANPCDTDYRSELSPGNINDMSVSELWQSDSYMALRRSHLENERGQVEPCARCTVV